MARLDPRFARNGGVLVLAAAGLLTFIGKWEDGGKPFPAEGYLVYADKLAGGLPTTCHGITRYVATVPVVVGERWSKEKCDAQREQALEKVQFRLIECFSGTPPQQVFNMATSHAWNNGTSATCGSSAMREWNAGHWLAGCKALSRAPDGKPVWSYVRTGKLLPNGKPEMKFVQGLANRREDETRECAGL